jgi:hypothetical protein
MPRRSLARLALLACLATSLSCAVADPSGVGREAGYSAPPAPNAARIGLAAPYRAFYDALEGQGDWVLIEPYGWVFRPRVNFDSWRPYQQGWWEPSDVFGWVWNSSDDFGWITDHYGSWFYDGYQGWVWQPGPVWGPAWVAWVAVGDYIGWAPLAPADYQDFSRVPGGLFTYSMAQQFGMQNSNSQALFTSRPPNGHEALVEITNFSRSSGVAFNRGPDPAMLLRLGAAVTARPEAPAYRHVKLPELRAPGESELLLRTRRLLVIGAREIAGQRERAQAPAAPPGDAAAPAPGHAGNVAPADTTTHEGWRSKDKPGAGGKPRRPANPGGRPGADPDTTGH